MYATTTYRHNPSATDVITPVLFATVRAVARIALLAVAVVGLAFTLLAVLRWYLASAAALTTTAWLVAVAPALVFGAVLVVPMGGLLWLFVRGRR